MVRKKILWLASWYPNKNDAFDGDFIQRHARAAAIHNDIHVIYVGEAMQESEEWNFVTGLTEQFIYFRKSKGLLSRWRKQNRWQQNFRSAIRSYIGKNGQPDLIHVHVAWKAGLAALWAKRKYGIPYLLTEHSSMYGPGGSYEQMPFPIRRLLRTLFREAHMLITVSQYLSSLLQKNMGRSADRIIPNVVDTTLFFPKEDKYSRFTFIHVSNMVTLKNADLILTSFARLAALKDLPDIQLVMAGNRDDHMVKLAGSLGLLNHSVFFRGELPYTGVAEEMRRAHALVLFSDDETFSCVTAEALCSGLPVIASDRGALPELIGGGAGILVPREQPEKLEEAMKEALLHFSRFDREKEAEKASRLYGYSAIAGQFRSLYSLGRTVESTGA